MAKTETTVKGYVYTVTSPNGGTVTDAEGKLSKTVDAGDQVTVTAPSDSLTCDDDDAVICKANFKSPLLALRLLGQGDNALPAGYTRVEFLESTGTQYINTKVFPTGDMNIQVDVMALSWVYCNYVFGNYQKSGANIVFSIDYNNAYSRGGMYRYGTQFAYFTQGAHKLNVRYNYEFAGNVVYRNGVLAQFLNGVKFTPETFTGENPILLFASRHDNFNIRADGTRRIWSFSITRPEGDVLNFIPALDPTGTPCMYDMVTREPFRKAGSGQFIAGMTLSQVRGLRLPASGGELTLSLPHEASIDRLAQAALEQARANGWELTLQYAEAEVPAGYRKLDFLESTGTQWIDTGYVPDNETGIYLYQLKIKSGDNIPMGCRNTTSTDSRFYALRAVVASGDASPGFGWGGWTIASTKIAGLSETYLNYMNERSAEGENYEASLGLLPFTPEYSIFMFAANISGEPSLLWVGRIYEAEITQGESAAMSFVPCISPDGKLGMYNKIGGTWHENAGNGAFIAGLATVDDVLTLRLPETGGTLTVSVPADTPDSAVEQLRANNPSWQIAIQYRES